MAQQITTYDQMADDMNLVLRDWAVPPGDAMWLRATATARLWKAGLRFDADRTTFKVIS